MNLRRSPECSAWPTVAPTWANCLIVSRICLSRMRRSVTTMIESKTVPVVVRRPMSWCASQAIEFDLPAAGRVLDQVAPARALFAWHRPAACAPRRAGDSAGKIWSRFFLPVFAVFASRRSARSSRGCRSGPRGVRMSLPQVISLQPVRVRRIAGAVVPALVERQEPGRLALKLGAEHRTCVSSTAKWTTQRPNSNSISRGSRSRLYCSTASSTVCLVRLFFSSKVATGRPLMNSARSSAGRSRRGCSASCRVTEKRFSAKRSRRLGVARRRRAVEQVDRAGPCLTPMRSTSMTPRLLISPCSRARNFCRVGLSLSRSSAGQQRRLCRGDEGAQLGQIDRPGAVVIVRVAEQPVMQADERLRLFAEPRAAGRRRPVRRSSLRR